MTGAGANIDATSSLFSIGLIALIVYCFAAGWPGLRPRLAAGSGLWYPDAMTDRFDSGLTHRELDRLFVRALGRKRIKEMSSFEAFSTALVLGVSDGDLVAVSNRGTIMLSTPRARIEANVAAVRAALDAGKTLDEALELLPASRPSEALR